MTVTRTMTLRAFAAGAFAVTLAVATWLLVTAAPRDRSADCAAAQQMWTFYQSQTASRRSAVLAPEGDNAATAVKYQAMISDLQARADHITTPDVRSHANQMVAINRSMFDQWKQWVAEGRTGPDEPAIPSSSDKQFGMEFAASARKLKLVHADLTAVCAS